MICQHCGHSMPEGSLTCDHCGTYIGKYSGNAQAESGVKAIRQGRRSASQPQIPAGSSRMKTYGDFDLSSIPLPPERDQAARKPAAQFQSQKGSSKPSRPRFGVPIQAGSRVPPVRHRGMKVHPVQKHGVNWMLIGLIGALIAVLIVVGVMLYNKNSDAGQRATARKFALSVSEPMFELAANEKDPLVQEQREELLKDWGGVSPQNYLFTGQDYMDIGDIEMAIHCFRIADIIEPESYDGLLLLANAYELNQNDEIAEQIYLHLAREISPFRAEAFTALIRMYQEQNRRPEAADMMLEAYQNTDKENFRLQRKEYIPLMPQVNMPSGRYEISAMKDQIRLTSPQGYDIYYTMDEKAELPKDGVLSEDGTIVPEEGTLNLRAVCVSDELKSDEMKVNYSFFYPSPPAPKSNLAPNTYKTLHEVMLRPGEIRDKEMTKREKAELEKHYEYYYTIDGSTPTLDSPKFDGTPIQLPSGKVTLKAICQNQYGKISPILQVMYKFEVKPWPLNMYSDEDTFSGFTLLKTTYEEFLSAFGQPKEELQSVYLNQEGNATHLNYDWGYAVFILRGNEWVLVRIEMYREIAKGPRGTGFGISETDITSVYKDFGQIVSPDGSRGLYYDPPNTGRVLINDDGTKTVEYACKTSASLVYVLQYHLNQNGSVDRITHYWQP